MAVPPTLKRNILATDSRSCENILFVILLRNWKEKNFYKRRLGFDKFLLYSDPLPNQKFNYRMILKFIYIH